MDVNPSKLKITEFGNPILRQEASLLTKAEITSSEIKQLIKDMRELAMSGKYGVGLAAPQVGKSIALSVITIRPTPSHPGREELNAVIINPHYKGLGKKVPMWEGCMSFGSNDNPVFAQVPRYKKIHVKYYDEHAKLQEETLDGFVAHVFQHETDHLNGVLFVDRVEDPTTWMNASEYKKLDKKSQ